MIRLQNAEKSPSANGTLRYSLKGASFRLSQPSRPVRQIDLSTD